jgi:hypothetical protein
VRFVVDGISIQGTPHWNWQYIRVVRDPSRWGSQSPDGTDESLNEGDLWLDAKGLARSAVDSELVPQGKDLSLNGAAGP